MAVLLDTNVLLRLLQPQHPQYSVTQRALEALRAANELLVVAPQNLVEFWAVVTRKLEENGLGFTVEQAVAEMSALKRLFLVLPELPLQAEWERLVTTHRVSGKNTHDARLVSAMVVNGVDRILTFNVEDFIRYPQIRVFAPVLVAGT